MVLTIILLFFTSLWLGVFLCIEGSTDGILHVVSTIVAKNPPRI